MNRSPDRPIVLTSPHDSLATNKKGSGYFLHFESPRSTSQGRSISPGSPTKSGSSNGSAHRKRRIGSRSPTKTSKPKERKPSEEVKDQFERPEEALAGEQCSPEPADCAGENKENREGNIDSMPRGNRAHPGKGERKSRADCIDSNPDEYESEQKVMNSVVGHHERDWEDDSEEDRVVIRSMSSSPVRRRPNLCTTEDADPLLPEPKGKNPYEEQLKVEVTEPQGDRVSPYGDFSSSEPRGELTTPSDASLFGSLLGSQPEEAGSQGGDSWGAFPAPFEGSSPLFIPGLDGPLDSGLAKFSLFSSQQKESPVPRGYSPLFDEAMLAMDQAEDEEKSLSIPNDPAREPPTESVPQPIAHEDATIAHAQPGGEVAPSSNVDTSFVDLVQDNQPISNPSAEEEEPDLVSVQNDYFSIPNFSMKDVQKQSLSRDPLTVAVGNDSDEDLEPLEIAELSASPIRREPFIVRSLSSSPENVLARSRSSLLPISLSIPDISPEVADEGDKDHSEPVELPAKFSEESLQPIQAHPVESEPHTKFPQESEISDFHYCSKGFPESESSVAMSSSPVPESQSPFERSRESSPLEPLFIRSMSSSPVSHLRRLKDDQASPIEGDGRLNVLESSMVKSASDKESDVEGSYEREKKGSDFDHTDEILSKQLKDGPITNLGKETPRSESTASLNDSVHSHGSKPVKEDKSDTDSEPDQPAQTDFAKQPLSSSLSWKERLMQVCETAAGCPCITSAHSMILLWLYEFFMFYLHIHLAVTKRILPIS